MLTCWYDVWLQNAQLVHYILSTRMPTKYDVYWLQRHTMMMIRTARWESHHCNTWSWPRWFDQLCFREPVFMWLSYHRFSVECPQCAFAVKIDIHYTSCIFLFAHLSPFGVGCGAAAVGAGTASAGGAKADWSVQLRLDDAATGLTIEGFCWSLAAPVSCPLIESECQSVFLLNHQKCAACVIVQQYHSHV